MLCTGSITTLRPWLARPDAHTAEAIRRATSLGHGRPSAVSRLHVRLPQTVGKPARARVGGSVCARACYVVPHAVRLSTSGGVVCRPIHGATSICSASRGVSDPQAPRKDGFRGRTAGVAHATASMLSSHLVRPGYGASHDRRYPPAYTSAIRPVSAPRSARQVHPRYSRGTP